MPRYVIGPDGARWLAQEKTPIAAGHQLGFARHVGDTNRLVGRECYHRGVVRLGELLTQVRQAFSPSAGCLSAGQIRLSYWLARWPGGAQPKVPAVEAPI